MDKYYTYILRCQEGSLYTGIARDPNRRMKEHFSKKGAKYTKTHIPSFIEIIWVSKNKPLACKLEFYLKSLKKIEKEKIIGGESLSHYLYGKIDSRKYHKVLLSDILEEKYYCSKKLIRANPKTKNIKIGGISDE